jgi:hypothetical protein
MTSETFVYRGVKLPLKIIDEYNDIKNKNGLLELSGFTSTSLKKEEALKFMFKGLKNEDIPVLYQINNLDKKGWYYFKLNNADYSLFSYEQEVLLVTGSKFLILEISEEVHKGRIYLLVRLKNMAFY